MNEKEKYNLHYKLYDVYDFQVKYVCRFLQFVFILPDH